MSPKLGIFPKIEAPIAVKLQSREVTVKLESSYNPQEISLARKSPQSEAEGTRSASG
jgi:hypothetical protein